MSSWTSYPKVYNLGHAAVKDLFLDDVIVEEKIDGSQFSFGVIDGVLRLRSKGKEMTAEMPEALFATAAAHVQARAHRLRPGWTYRCEYLSKPKHNVLAYDRVPQDNLILFDINTGEEQYLSYDVKRDEAAMLELETVPLLAQGSIQSADQLRELLETRSCLGGQRVEGVVVKNYKRFGVDGKALLGKYVSEAFKEVHAGEWRKANPTASDIVDRLIMTYRTPARWQKALQHLTEAGVIENSPRDIGKLFPEVVADTRAECEAEIKEMLFKHVWPKLQRGITAGLPEWYKSLLLEKQFNA